MPPLDLEPVRAQAAIVSPLTFPAAMQAAWLLFRMHAGGLLKVFAPVLLILYSGAWVVFELTPLSGSDPGNESSATVSAIWVAFFLNIVLGVCVSSVLVGVGAARLGATAAGGSLRGLPLRDLIAAGLVVAMIPLVFVFSGPLIVLAPLLLRLVLGPPVVAHEIVFEGKKLGESAQSARRLLAGSWGRVLLWLLTVSIVLGLISSAAFRGSSDLLVTLLGSSAPTRFLIGFAAGGVEAIVLAFFAVVSMVIYVDLKQRAALIES